MTSVTSDPRIGTELAGYRIEALIGRGISTVYRAADPDPQAQGGAEADQP